MIRLLTIIFILLWGCVIANAQTTQEQPDTATLVRALNKALNEVETSRVALTASERVIAAQDAELKALKAQITALERLNELKDKEVSRLIQVKCQQTKLLFGIVSWRRCY